MEKLKRVKLDKAEILFKNKIEYMRMREEQYINQVNKYRAIATFIMDLTPLFSVLLVLWFETLRGSSLDLTTTYTVVSIISNMNKPLKRFVNILDRYYEYHHAKQSLNRLLFMIPDKPKEAEYDENLKTGEVVLDDCKIEVVKDESMKKSLSKIFGDEINLQKEMSSFGEMMRKADSSNMNDHLDEEPVTDNPDLKAESAAFMKHNFTSKLMNRKKSHPFPEINKKTLVACLNLHIKPKSKVFFINAPSVKNDSQGQPTENYTRTKNSHPHQVIHSLLGENYLPYDNSLRFKGKVVYQNLTKPTFLDHSSIRENILFGEIMIKERYEKVLDLVGLDLDKFPGNDQFEIVFKGNNLSITERKKVLLARMLYVSGDIYILEGFFSGSDSRENNYNEVDKLDENVEEKEYLWNKLTTNNGFLHHKTVIVVEDMGGKLTNVDNYSEIIRKVDKIVVFGTSSDVNPEGIQQFNGFEEYNEFYKDDEEFVLSRRMSGNMTQRKKKGKQTLYGITSNKIFQKSAGKLLQKAHFSSHNMTLFDKKNISNLKQKQELDPFKNLTPKNLKMISNQNVKLQIPEGMDSLGNHILAKILPGMVKLQEKRSIGRIKSAYDDSEIYKKLRVSVFKYIFLLGKTRVFCQFFFFLITTTLFIAINIYAGAWSNDIFEWDTTKYMLVYLGLSIFTSVAGFIRDLTFTNMLMENAKAVHQRLVMSLCNMYLGWFNKNSGVNIPFLLSYDIRRIDEVINFQIERGLESLVFVIGGLFLINWIYMAITLIISLLCGIYLWFTMKKFFKTTVSLVKFIAENTASFQDLLHLTMEEIFEYRVMMCEHILENKFQNTSNEMQRAMTHLGFYCKRWLGVRVGFINTILIFQAYMTPIIFEIFFHQYIDLSLLELALVISWSLKLVGYLTSLINCMVSVFNNIVSFGRIEYFLNELKTEKLDALKYKPKIENINYMIYMDKISVTLGNRKILDEITFKMKKGKKVGLLGASGSGKHSLCNLIMRVYDSDKTKSKKSFMLVGKETELVNHFDQRKRVGYLSSDPVLFSGTIRENIDPTYRFNDYQIMSVLKYFDGISVLKKNFANKFKNSLFSNMTGDINAFFKNQKTKVNVGVLDKIAEESQRGKTPAQSFLESIPQEMKSSEEKRADAQIERSKAFGPFLLKERFPDFEIRRGSRRLDTENQPLDTESAQVLITDFDNHLLTHNLDTEYDKLVNDPLHQTVTKPEIKIMNQFLCMNVKSSKDLPISVIKLIKVVKIILEEPLIYIVDKSALEFSPKRNIKETMCLFLSSTTVKNSNVILVFNTVFDYMYLLDDIVMMDKGKIMSSGGVEQTLNKWLEINRKKQNGLSKAAPRAVKTELKKEEKKLRELMLSHKQLGSVGNMMYMMSVAFSDKNTTPLITSNSEESIATLKKDVKKFEIGDKSKVKMEENNDASKKIRSKEKDNFLEKKFNSSISELNDRASDQPQIMTKMTKYAFNI